MSEPVSSIGPGMPFGHVKEIPLYFIFICDISNSMRYGKKIEALNMAIEKVITFLKIFSKKTPALPIFIRAIKFSTGAEWVNSDFIPLKKYQWKTLESDGGIPDLGEALSKVADTLRFKKDGGLMPETWTIEPHFVLITHGYPTDLWELGLKKLDSTFWGMDAVRCAVAPGDAGDDYKIMGILRRFVGNGKDEDRHICSSGRIQSGLMKNSK